MRSSHVLICFSVLVGLAWTSGPQRQSTARFQSPFGWATTPWTKQAPELERIKEKAEGLASKGTEGAAELVALARAAKRDYEREPSALGLFRWCTYAFEAGRWSVDKYFGDEKSNYPLNHHFQRHGKEYWDVYIYARMRFIREAAIGTGTSHVPIGKRLLDKDPNDRDVKLFMMRICSAFTSEIEALGKKISEEMLKAQPNDPMTLYSGGRYYWSIWFTKRRDADKTRGISLLNKFVSLAPSDLNSVRSAKKMIEMMRTDWRPDGGGKSGGGG